MNYFSRILSLVIIFGLISIQFSDAKYGDILSDKDALSKQSSYGSLDSPEKSTNVEISTSRHCVDYVGRKIQSLMHFVPEGGDMCKLCICENGQAKSCRAVLCTPPNECKSFQVGASCCEFICIDDHLERGDVKLKPVRIITCVLGFISTVVVISCCICFCKRTKKTPNAEQDPNAVSRVEFTEDLYLKMSVEMIEKNEEIIDLRKRIHELESHLSNGEVSNRNGGQGSDNPWKNEYDLHVDIRA